MKGSAQHQQHVSHRRAHRTGAMGGIQCHPQTDKSDRLAANRDETCCGFGYSTQSRSFPAHRHSGRTGPTDSSHPDMSQPASAVYQTGLHYQHWSCRHVRENLIAGENPCSLGNTSIHQHPARFCSDPSALPSSTRRAMGSKIALPDFLSAGDSKNRLYC